MVVVVVADWFIGSRVPSLPVLLLCRLSHGQDLRRLPISLTILREIRDSTFSRMWLLSTKYPTISPLKASLLTKNRFKKFSSRKNGTSPAPAVNLAWVSGVQ